MGFYDSEDGVNQYFAMAEGVDGTEIIENLKRYLPKNSSVLELGMGPGKDLDILVRDFIATGSDTSDLFLRRYRTTNPQAKLLMLDALLLDTTETFDCIYSNKVLHHLHREDLPKSIHRQAEIVNSNGLVCHTFWQGEGQEVHADLNFTKYLKEELRTLFSIHFNVVHLSSYKEFTDGDSILIIASKLLLGDN